MSDLRRESIAKQLRILYWENDQLLRQLAKERDPEECTALRTELAEVRRCIAQEKGWLAELDKEQAAPTLEPLESASETSPFPSPRAMTPAPNPKEAA
jgi:hypothetical protein